MGLQHLQDMEVKELRIKAGMSQQKFADYFEMPVRNIQNWESKSKKSSRHLAEYWIKLMEYKLVNEGLIEQET